MRVSSRFVLLCLIVFSSVAAVLGQYDMDLNAHCYYHGRSQGAVLIGSTVDDWRCRDALGWDHGINMQALCVEQYGAGSTASYSDFNNAGSWKCSGSSNSGNSGSSNNDSGNSGDRGCDISAFDTSASGTVWWGDEVYLTGNSNCGTTKFQISGMDKAETGQPNNSETWKTGEFAPGEYEVCFVARGNGGWGNADYRCKWFTVSDGSTSSNSDNGNSGNSGSTDSGSSNNSGDSGSSDSGSSNNDSGNAGNSGNTGSSDSSGSSCNAWTPVYGGDRAQITAGDANNMRSGPSTGSQYIGSLPAYTQFDVLSGPYCADNATFIELELDDGTRGYTAVGTSGNPWVEKVGGGSGSEETVSNEPVWLDFYYSPFDTTYSLLIDSSDKDNCVILNGADVIVKELRRANHWISEVSMQESVTTTGVEMYHYIMNSGDIDTFRVSIDSFLVRNARCQHSYYQVGSKTMDLFGLGNVAFGFFFVIIPNGTLHFIADYVQWKEDGRRDYPDDADQIDLGSALAWDVLRGNNLSTNLVVNNMPNDFVESR